MINEIVVVITLALAASFLPLHLGAEIAMLGTKGGFSRALAFVSGLAAWRVFIALLWIFFAANGARNVRNGPDEVLAGIIDTFAVRFRPGPTWTFALEVLLTMAGVALIIYGVRQLAHIPGDDEMAMEQVAGEQANTQEGSRFATMPAYRAFLFGFVWLAVGMNSYLLMFAAYQQITLLPTTLVPKLLVLLLFLVLANTLLSIPLVIYALSPHRAQRTLGTFYAYFQKIGRWLGIGLSLLIGIYLTWQGLGSLLF